MWAAIGERRTLDNHDAAAAAGSSARLIRCARSEPKTSERSLNTTAAASVAILAVSTVAAFAMNSSSCCFKRAAAISEECNFRWALAAVGG